MIPSASLCAGMRTATAVVPAISGRSSGFARLDEAAIAAVLKARFRPYSDNGQPLAGWALVPLSFDLQT